MYEILLSIASEYMKEIGVGESWGTGVEREYSKDHPRMDVGIKVSVVAKLWWENRHSTGPLLAGPLPLPAFAYLRWRF